VDNVAELALSVIGDIDHRLVSFSPHPSWSLLNRRMLIASPRERRRHRWPRCSVTFPRRYPITICAAPPRLPPAAHHPTPR
jgi:hypothetical protein